MKPKKLPAWKEAVRGVSRLTGHTPLFHLADAFLCNLAYGCDAVQYGEGGFWRLKRSERRNTYTKQRAYALSPKFNPGSASHLCKRKEEFNRFFAMYIHRPWLFCRNASEEEIARFIDAQPRVIVKQTNAMQGRGVYELDKTTGPAAIARQFAGQDVLLERWIVQHPDLCFGSRSVNTIRITTVRDRQGNVHLLKAALRCGVGTSIVDNFTQGGVVYPIDMEKGVIESCGTRKHSVADGLIDVHPGTDFRMPGQHIPFWPETLSMIRDAAARIPELRLIGWDVAITPDGPELVEGNTRPGPALIEYVGTKKGFYQEILSYL